ncbi:MAG: acyl carrier protein [Bacteroidetes bacterium]|nr:acyl carrier protein [Bacteroidota bacterium]
MTKQEVADIINGFLVDEFEVDAASITPDAPLKETLDLDSLDYVDLVVVIENNFGVKLTGDDFKSINTFDEFYNFIIDKVSKK